MPGPHPDGPHPDEPRPEERQPDGPGPVEPWQLLTPRLRLLAVDTSLAAEVTAGLTTLYADPDVARHLGGEVYDAAGTQRQVAAFAAEWAREGWGTSVLLDRATGALVGRAGLHRWLPGGPVELGYVLARDRWGRGLAREASGAWLAWADEHLPRADPPVGAVVVEVEPANTASLRLAERLGFTPEREAATSRGVPVLVLSRPLGTAAGRPPGASGGGQPSVGQVPGC